MPTARAKSVREVYDWAMQQPGGQATCGQHCAGRTPAPTPANVRAVAAHAVDANIETLLAGVMNWQPGSFFSERHRPASSPLSFRVGLLDLFPSAREGELLLGVQHFGDARFQFLGKRQRPPCWTYPSPCRDRSPGWR